jgi:hypothetical protein
LGYQRRRWIRRLGIGFDERHELPAEAVRFVNGVEIAFALTASAILSYERATLGYVDETFTLARTEGSKI